MELFFLHVHVMKLSALQTMKRVQTENPFGVAGLWLEQLLCRVRAPLSMKVGQRFYLMQFCAASSVCRSVSCESPSQSVVQEELEYSVSVILDRKVIFDRPVL